MNRKAILAASVILVAVFAIGSVSAFDLGSIIGGDENQTVTIDGVNFNIPKGFEEDPSHAIDNQKNDQAGIPYTTNGKLYEKDDVVVVLLVADYGEYKVTDDILKSVGGEKTTIGNVTGYLASDEELHVFNYEKDDKLVVISASDEDIISEFIIG